MGVEPRAEQSTATLGPRARGKAEKLSRIKAAARTLFGERGFELTTTQAVAELAGIGSGTLFSYVKTKEDLLVLVFIDELIEQATASRRRAEQKTDLLEQVFTLYSALLAHHYGIPELSRRLVREVAFVRDSDRAVQIQRLMDLLEGGVAEFVRRLADAGGFPSDVDPLAVAKNCFAIYYMTLQSGLRTQAPFAAVNSELRERLALQIRPLQALRSAPPPISTALEIT